MAQSTLVVYEPVDMTDKAYYWKEYAEFYEKYWGGPTSPFGVWFGNEYESFVQAIAAHLGVDKDELEHCFFTKDDEGKYYVAPFRSKSNLFFSENFIPLEWFLLFSAEDRETLYTHWGFNALYYNTRIGTAIERLDDAAEVVTKSIEGGGAAIGKEYGFDMQTLLASLRDLKGWLSGYDPTGFIVLNYGDLCAVINPYSLERERSVEEAWAFIGRLREGKFDEAASSLKAFLQKWDDIRTTASASAGGGPDDSTLQ